MLDLLDRKLLFELDKDSRISLTGLSKKLRRSKEVIHYRMKKLEESGVITSYEIFVNFASFDKMTIGVYFRPKKITADKEKELLNFLLKYPTIARVSQSIGEFDLSIAVEAKNLYELDRTVAEIKSAFPGEIGDYEVHTRVKALRFSRNYLINQKRKIHESMTLADYTLPKFNGDDLDKKILYSLSKNARKSGLEIAKELNVSNSTIISRLKRLKKKKVITLSTIFINHNKMGYECYRLLIKTNDLTPEKEHKLISYCESNPNITHYLRGIGVWNVEFIIEVENLLQYHSIYKEIGTLFSQDIQKMTSLTMFNNLMEVTSAIFID